jgi:hypothetical protein
VKDNSLPFPPANPNPVAHLRDELSFEMHGDSRLLELVEREPLGIMPKMIQVPFALLKEAVSQILMVEAAGDAAKHGAKINQKTGQFDRRSLPVGIQRKMQVADILHTESEKELTEAHANAIADQASEQVRKNHEPDRKQIPGFDA